MKVDAQRGNVNAQRLREQSQRDAAAEEAARRFQKQWLRRRKQEEDAPVGVAGPFERMTPRCERQEDPATIHPAFLPLPVRPLPDGVAQSAPDLVPVGDPEIARLDLQDAVRLDAIARTAMDAGLKVAMAQNRGEYQVELGSALFTRTRLRVRGGDHLGIEIRCESDSASEREWFDRHREALAGRIAGLTGRAVRLDIVDLMP